MDILALVSTLAMGVIAVAVAVVNLPRAEAEHARR